MAEVTLPITSIRIADTKPHPRNYRSHPKDQVAHLAASIQQNGIYRPVVVARDYTILAGHGVVEAARSLGMEEIPAVVMDIAPDDARAIKLLAADNEITRFADVDDRALTDLLKELKGDEFGLLGTGWDDMMLANLVSVTRPQPEIADFDAAAEWVGMPEYVPAGIQFRVMVQFQSEEDRTAFLDKAGVNKEMCVQRGDSGLMTTWWPQQGKNDAISVRYEGDKK